MKITRATIKSFVNKNKSSLYIKVKSDFNSMTDCVEAQQGGFTKVKSDEWANQNEKYTLGVRGLWLVGNSRDSFKPYNEEGFNGYEVSNCCGVSIIATRA